MRPVHTLLLILGLTGFVSGLVGCTRSFWYRNPQVAGRYQQAAPDACAPCPPSYAAPCPPSGSPYAVQTPAPSPGPSVCPPNPCPPSPCPPYPCPTPSYGAAPCPPMPDIPPSEPGGQSPRPSPSSSYGAAPSADEQQVFALVNQVRRSSGLRPLAWNGQLHQAAAAHSDEQYRYGYMGHGSPDPSRRTLLQRIQVTGYDGRCFGEVVAWGYTSPQAVVEGWMNSRDHRAILMDRDLTEVGFSRVGDYWTGNFGTPRAPRAVAYGAPPPRAPVAPTRTWTAPIPTPAPVATAPTPPPASAYAPPASTPAPAPPVRTYFRPAPRPTPQPTYRAPARGG